MTWLLQPLTSNTYWTYTENVFTEEELDRIVEQCSQLPVHNGGVETGEQVNTFRQSTISWVPTDNPDFHWIYTKLAAAVRNVNDSYFKFDITHIQTLQFTKYTADKGFYKPHLDVGMYATGRKLTFSLQLSDPYHHKGGELVFHHLKTEPEMAPRARGKIIFFPSFLVHEVLPVTEGVRYSLVGWVAGPQFK